MKIIYKYTVLIKDDFTLDIPKGAIFLDFKFQRGKPVMWVLFDEEKEFELETYHFSIAGTGHAVSNRYVSYLGTALTLDGSLVWHLFAKDMYKT